MTFSLTALVLALAAPPVEPLTEMWQVAPDTSEKPWVAPDVPSDKSRAVVLVHGLFIHPLRPSKAKEPWLRTWQEPKSEMVKALAKDFDVFSLAYAQTAPVDDIVRAPTLRDAIVRLRKAGYKEVVLIGHSAGGVIVRQFMEQFPDAGATKAIAVAAPFAGVEIATLKIGYARVQEPFVDSLAPGPRATATKANKAPLGKDVQIVCVVCKLPLVDTDGLVFTRSQWTEDLQQLGVPAVLADVNHFTAMYQPATIKQVAELAREKLVRWSPEEVEKARTVLFGEPNARRDK